METLEFCSSCQNHRRPNSLENCAFVENKTQSFQKLFSGYIFLYLLNILATAVPKSKQKISKMIRGGVEDTRLEAKDTKKIRGQGQGQPFRGQTLSRPRTGMLEAKAKDKGHKRKCSPKKKKVFTKIFQAISKKKGLHKNFSSDHHEKTFSIKFFKRSTKF